MKTTDIQITHRKFIGHLDVGIGQLGSSYYPVILGYGTQGNKTRQLISFQYLNRLLTQAYYSDPPEGICSLDFLIDLYYDFKPDTPIRIDFYPLALDILNPEQFLENLSQRYTQFQQSHH